MPEHVVEYEAEIEEKWEKQIRKKRKVEGMEDERRCIFFFLFCSAIVARC